MYFVMNTLYLVIYVYVYISPSFYRQVKSEAAVNCVLVKANKYSRRCCKRKSRENKLTSFFAAFGYAVGLGNVWKFRTLPRNLGVVSVRRVARGWPVQRSSSEEQFKREN